MEVLAERRGDPGRALFFSSSVGLLFQVFPKAILDVILFFAGAELAVTTDIGSKKEDVYVMLVVAGFAMWNMARRSWRAFSCTRRCGEDG